MESRAEVAQSSQQGHPHSHPQPDTQIRLAKLSPAQPRSAQPHALMSQIDIDYSMSLK